jgi:hypothetical protein
MAVGWWGGGGASGVSPSAACSVSFRCRKEYAIKPPVMASHSSRENEPECLPTVLDRMIQQAVAQVLGPLFEAVFGEHRWMERSGVKAIWIVLRSVSLPACKSPHADTRGSRAKPQRRKGWIDSIHSLFLCALAALRETFFFLWSIIRQGNGWQWNDGNSYMAPFLCPPFFSHSFFDRTSKSTQPH